MIAVVNRLEKRNCGPSRAAFARQPEGNAPREDSSLPAAGKNLPAAAKNLPAAAKNLPAAAKKRASGEKGSAVLEAALVLLPFLALMFALMDYSIALFLQNTLRNAVREGVRFAISQQTGASGQDAAIKATVERNSMGFLSDPSLISITYYNQSLTAVTGVGSNAGGNICVVSVTGFPWTWFAPFMRSATPLSFWATSSDVMEQPPNGVLPAR